VEDPKDDQGPERDSDAQESIYLRVTADCAQWLGIEVDRDTEGGFKLKVDDLKDEMTLGFARAGAQGFVVSQDKSSQLPDASSNDPAGPVPEAADERPSGHVLVAYAAEDDGVVFRLIDPRPVAHLIIDDEIPGWLEKRDRRPDGSVDVMAKRYSVYVFGNPEATSALLQAHDLLGPPWMRLRPADAPTGAAMDEWIAQAAATTEAAAAGPPEGP
jgi:hypothetical protein